MASSKGYKPRNSPATNIFTSSEENDDPHKVIQPWFMEENFMKSHKSYFHICKNSLREFLTKAPDRICMNIVSEFYSNLSLVGTSLKSFEIDIHKDQF